MKRLKSILRYLYKFYNIYIYEIGANLFICIYINLNLFKYVYYITSLYISLLYYIH
jgi:hypothetical protein